MFLKLMVSAVDDAIVQERISLIPTDKICDVKECEDGKVQVSVQRGNAIVCYTGSYTLDEIMQITSDCCDESTEDKCDVLVDVDGCCLLDVDGCALLQTA